MGALAFPHPPLAAGRLAAKLLNRHSPHEIAEAIEVLVDVLDLLGGDADAEDNGDAELVGDELDMAWPEWRGRGEQRPVGTLHRNGDTPYLPHEDDEEDDSSGQYDEDYVTGPRPRGYGPGCPIADPDFGSEEQGEDEQAGPPLTYGDDQSRGPIGPLPA